MKTAFIYLGRVALLLGIFALGASQGAFANVLGIEWTEEYTGNESKAEPSQKGKAGKVSIEKRQTSGVISVDIGDACFAANGGSRFYDFKKKLSWYETKEDGVWFRSSLYSDLGFRVMEYQNRLYLAEMLQRVGVTMPKGVNMETPLSVQSLFGIVLPGQTPEKLSKKKEKMDLVWRFKKEEWVRVRFLNDKIPEEFLPAWRLFFTYTFRMHPDIRREILAEGKLPELLTFKVVNTGSEGRFEYRLKKFAVKEGSIERRYEGKAQKETNDKELAEVIAMTRGPLASDRHLSWKSVSAYADKRMGEGVLLDALLAVNEYGFQTGGFREMQEFMWTYRTKLESDGQSLLYISAAEEKSDKGGAEAALRKLEKIDRKPLEKACILDIHKGNYLVYLGNLVGAREAFLSVLRINPMIAGVYNDLGQVYFSGYDMESAWACWDTARRLYPEHGMLMDVTDNERRMEKDFPDFFLPYF